MADQPHTDTIIADIDRAATAWRDFAARPAGLTDDEMDAQAAAVRALVDSWAYLRHCIENQGCPLPAAWAQAAAFCGPVGDLCEEAWGLLADVSGGTWAMQAPQWQVAAARWRDKWHTVLAGAAADSGPPPCMACDGTGRREYDETAPATAACDECGGTGREPQQVTPLRALAVIPAAPPPPPGPWQRAFTGLDRLGPAEVHIKGHDYVEGDVTVGMMFGERWLRVDPAGGRDQPVFLPPSSIHRLSPLVPVPEVRAADHDPWAGGDDDDDREPDPF